MGDACIASLEPAPLHHFPPLHITRQPLTGGHIVWEFDVLTLVSLFPPPLAPHTRSPRPSHSPTIATCPCSPSLTGGCAQHRPRWKPDHRLIRTTQPQSLSSAFTLIEALGYRSKRGGGVVGFLASARNGACLRSHRAAKHSFFHRHGPP